MAVGVTERALEQVADPARLFNVPRGLRRYVRDLRRYRSLPGAEPIRTRDLHPQLHDQLAASPYDWHYFFQDVWAARRVAELRPKRHTDVGSRVDLVGFLTALTQVTFVDIRPLDVDLPDLETMAGSILDLPFADRSLESVSCLHVAEHIGLGRYGDELNPGGTREAAAELERVVATGGQLLFSLPVGKPRVCFNAHRIHDPRALPEMFSQLRLVEFAGVDDDHRFCPDCAPEDLADSRYACGLFRFQRD